MHSFFPIGEQAHWQTDIVAQPEIKQWLFDPMSLTAKLKQISSQFKLEVLGQAWFTPKDHTELNFSEPSLIREVLLYSQGRAWVYAHTQVPKSTIDSGNQSIANLGEQPLGENIFKHPNLSRANIEVAAFDLSSRVFKLAQSLNQKALPSTLYGRRSLFKLADKPLTVTEIFLADCEIYD